MRSPAALIEHGDVPVPEDDTAGDVSALHLELERVASPLTGFRAFQLCGEIRDRRDELADRLLRPRARWRAFSRGAAASRVPVFICSFRKVTVAARLKPPRGAFNGLLLSTCFAIRASAVLQGLPCGVVRDLTYHHSGISLLPGSLYGN